MNSITQIINENIQKDRKSHEVKSWTPSRLGSCLTGLYLERLGIEPDKDFDEKTLRIFSVGKIFEEWVVDQIKESYQVDTQIRLEWPEYDMTGYADALIEDTVYEFKTIHSGGIRRLYQENKPYDHHVKQLWVAMKILKKDTGRLVYIGKDSLGILEFPVSIDDPLGEEALEELAILNEAWEKKLPPNPPADSKDWRARYCRFHVKCVSQPQYLT